MILTYLTHLVHTFFLRVEKLVALTEVKLWIVCILAHEWVRPTIPGGFLWFLCRKQGPCSVVISMQRRCRCCIGLIQTVKQHMILGGHPLPACTDAQTICWLEDQLCA